LVISLGRSAVRRFTLARQFRAATDETISRYILRLRLALALERLAEGEDDIAALAVSLGFSHHSHFSARFRAAFGMTPSEAREVLTNRQLEELRAMATGLPGLRHSTPRP
jgi:AraC family transcriptional regulator